MKQNTQSATPQNTITKTFEYKISRPTGEFVGACEQALNASRFVYNCALEQRIMHYRQTCKDISFYEQSRQLTEARKESPELRATLRTIQSDALERLDFAFDAFFRRLKNGEKPGFPRFKGRDRYDTFSQKYEAVRRCPLTGDVLIVPGVGRCRVHLSRPMKGRCVQLRISRKADGWYALLVCTMDKPAPLPKTGQSVGVDVGIKEFATLSNGETIANPRPLKKASRKLKKLQKRLSSKPKGTANRRKARKKVALAHMAVTRTRKDFHHKEAKKLVDRFDHIAVEDLNIKGMVKNHKLAEAISDVAWNSFFLITKSKAAEAGRTFEKVNPRYTSMTCSHCAHVQKMLLAIRLFVCEACEFVIDRDHNAAINISCRGELSRTTKACGARQRAKKQERAGQKRASDPTGSERVAFLPARS